MKTEIGFADKLTRAVALVEQVKTLSVKNAQEHQAAGVKVAAIRDLEKALADEYAAHPVVIAAKSLQAQKGGLAKILEDARKTAKCKMIEWEDNEERLRQAEENRLQAEAKKRAEDEALAAAQAAQDAGQHEEAQAIISEPVAVPIVIIPKTVAKIAGHSRRVIPKFRIVNAALIPRQYLIPNEVAIGGVIRSLRSAAYIPGVEYYEEVA